MPKGVLLSHDSQRWSLERGARLFGDRDSNVYIVAAPMFHMNATISTKGAMVAGATTVLLPTFDAMAYARSIDAFGVTSLTSVPTMLALVAKQADALDGLDFSSVIEVTMGSAPLTQALIDKVQALFPGATISNSYGTTEGGPSPFGPHPDGVTRPALSLGYPAEGLEVELREGDSLDEGVFHIRGPMSMEGYNNLPEKTAAVMQDGWYRSGDIMRRDENGFFYFVGRADDMFNVGGENVWPGEVEKLIETMDGVHQACVVPRAARNQDLRPICLRGAAVRRGIDRRCGKAVHPRERTGLCPPAQRPLYRQDPTGRHEQARSQSADGKSEEGVGGLSTAGNFRPKCSWLFHKCFLCKGGG